MTDDRDGDDDANIPLHIHQTPNSPNPLIDKSPSIAPSSDGSSLPLEPTNADDAITFTTGIAPNAPYDSVANGTFREANLTRRHTTLP